MLVLGGTYTMKLAMNNKTEITSTTNIQDFDDKSYEFDYPQTVGAGVSYLWNNRLLIGADVTWMELSKAKYYSQEDVFTDRFVYALGAEYVHNPLSKNYAEQMRFRLGANYSNSYVKVNGSDYNKWAISCGIGFPLPNTKTTLNLHLEYGQQGSVKNIGLVEQYGKIGIGVSLNERWFVKRRFK
jgi:long-subunit fatty acid transport protein